MSKKSIKKVAMSDIDILQDIAKNTFEETFSRDNSEENLKKYVVEAFAVTQLQTELNSPYSSFYFSLLDNEVIGYLKLNRGSAQTEIKEERGVEIERIYVLEAYQREGIGQFLLDFALKFAHENQAEYVWLGVWEKNPKAIRFYEKNGFEVFDSHLFMFGDDPQTDILMKRSL